MKNINRGFDSTYPVAIKRLRDEHLPSEKNQGWMKKTNRLPRLTYKTLQVYQFNEGLKRLHILSLVRSAIIGGVRLFPV